MGDGDYAFLGIELIKNQNNSGDFNWYKSGGPKNQEARKMFESLMVVSVRVPTSDEFKIFVKQLTNSSKTKLNTTIGEISVNPIVAAFYDCVLMYAWSLNKTLAEGGNPRDGYSLVRQLWNVSFVAGGLTGNISINENGDREADFTLNDMDPVTGKMRPVATYFGGRRVYEIIEGSPVHWPGGSPPDDVPMCGFLGDAPRCRPVEGFPVGASASLVICLLLLMGSLGGIILYRRMKFESQLSDFWWKVRWDDIMFAQNIAPKSIGSVRAMEDNLNKANAGSYSNLSTLAEAPIAGNVGIYKGIKVVVIKLPMKKFAVTRAVLMEVKQTRDLTHENLVRFVGLCIENPNFAILTELCSRGSLQDMLQNESIKIDWVFRYSMISDIVEGLLFIHNSSIGVHGRLRSSNCVIDGRFVVKLSGYGLQSVYDQTLNEEEMNPKSLFWCAPEHLREIHPMRHGSKKGDVYSFAIILQELITRTAPYITFQRLSMKREQMEPEEILDRVRMSTIPPFRPEVSPECGPSDLLHLMRKCWSENPDERPTFPEIKAQLKVITKGISSKNFLDNLLNRMEQYANNLESLVEEKTRSLVEEKKKTEELLYQLLPRYVADELKRGHHVTPEAFESVTIFFSDVVGFTPLAAESTPMEVVDLLNDLYSCFDATIENYNVYKVETIGDAYMVVSGLPIRNGYDHAKEIARMSLSVRDAMGKFRIRHRNDKKLQVRIGVHSGSCAAGVVGLKMPRYCLFGDTVNTASRMESNGQAMKIHVSSKTKDILDMFGTFRLSLRGDIHIKGKGIMTTFWLEGEDAFDYESSPSNPTVDELLDA